MRALYAGLMISWQKSKRCDFVKSFQASRIQSRIKMKRLFYLIIFILFGAYWLGFEYPDFLYETADMTPLYTTRFFVRNMIAAPGGLLAFVASFLQSSFAIPWLGAACLLIVLVVIPYVLKVGLKIDERFEGFYWLPSWAILLNYTQLGYMIYVLKLPAVAMMFPLGILLAVALLGIYRFLCLIEGIEGLLCKVIWILMIATLGYYAFGFYALYALVLIAIDSLRKTNRPTGQYIRLSKMLILGTIFISTFVPLIFYGFNLLQIRKDQIYTIGLPDYRWTGTEKDLWWPVGFTLIWIVLLCMLWSDSKHMERKDLKPLHNKKDLYVRLMAFASFLIGGYMVYATSYRDINYKRIIQMRHAVDNGEWERVLDMAREMRYDQNEQVLPTRLQVLYTRLALYETQKMGEETFRYVDGDAPYNALRNNKYLRLIGGHSLYYYYGKLNYSYRWCMDDMVEYGMRPAYLKYMLRCAVVNDEKELARKYADILRSHPFYKDFVKEYYDTPSEKAHKEFANVRKLLNYENVLDGDGGFIEAYLLNSYALMEGGSREMTELSLMACLIRKDMDGFWRSFIRLLPVFADGNIPIHYQEAALLFSRLKPVIDISGLPISSAVHERFERLIEASETNAGVNDEYNRLMLCSSFGDTYWYYYFFMTGLKTN